MPPKLSSAQKAEVLIEALPYIQRFYDKTIVVKYGGNAMTDIALQEDFAEDIVLLKLIGMNPVVEMVLGGLINQEIVTLINKAGGKAVGLTGKDGHFIHARKLKLPSKEDKKKKIDVGLVGEVVRIDPEIIHLLDERDFIPVIAPIGADEHGTAYNINADVAAGKLAITLQAEKLILLTNTTGVLDKEGKVVTGLTSKRVKDMIDDGTISGGMLPKVECALDAVKSGVKSAHIIDGRVSHALLLEVLTTTGVGTLIRGAAANRADHR